MKKLEISKLYNSLIDDIDKCIMKSNKYQKARKKVHIKEDELRDFIGKDGFKKQEEFMDEYIEFMDEYQKNPRLSMNALSLLTREYYQNIVNGK